jgi:hypothetical protein
MMPSGIQKEGFMKEEPEKRKYWQEHIEAWKSSDLIRRAYYAQNGIKSSTLDYWNHKLGTSRKRTQADCLFTSSVVMASPIPE